MKLFVAVTLYEGKLFAKCAESVMKGIEVLNKNGHEAILYFGDDLYIDLARNVCVKNFLSTDCTDMLFVDADVSFSDTAMLDIIKYDKPIVAGAYPMKHDTQQYSVKVDWTRNNNCKEEETGLIYVTGAPAGFMRIQRSVFDIMKKGYDMPKDKLGIYHFFETGMKVFNDGQWWGEDTAFCEKWIRLGKEIMVEPRLDFTHIGKKEYSGNLHKYFMGRRADTTDENSLLAQLTEDIQIIEGDLDIIKRLASTMDSVVEVGCWKGRTTKELLKLCNKVYAVDHFMGSPEDISGDLAKKFNVFSEFKKNVGYHPNLVLLKGNSVDMANRLNGDKVDMVFIDAGHTYEEVKADIEAWLPKTKKIISGHDYDNYFDGVRQAVNEFAEGRELNVEGSVWWVKL